MERPFRLLVTCEHGGNRIPARYAELFRDERAALESHAGHDLGALALARTLARVLGRQWPTRLIYSTTSRLLVDLNRSLGHRRLHGAPVRALEPAERQAIVDRHYRPYRSAVEGAVEADVEAGARVLHVSCHTFTPDWDGNERDAGIGLLFDPSRRLEVRVAHAWRAALEGGEPALKVRFNYPYLGTADGFTTALRRRHGDARYAGLELEVNQRFPLGSPAAWRSLQRRIAGALRDGVCPPRREATKRPGSGVERRSRDVLRDQLRVR